MKIAYKDNLSLALALAAIVISVAALCMSYLTREDTRDLGHLDLEPDIKLQTSFKSDVTPTHFRITNNGPITATQIKIEGKVLRYIEADRKVMIELGASDLEWVIGDLKPLEDTTVVFDEALLSSFFDPSAKPEYNIFILRVFYRRASDMMLFVDQAYYFFNYDGKWVSEASISSVDSIYGPIKKAALAWPPPGLAIDRFFSDRLHPIDPNDHQSWYGD